MPSSGSPAKRKTGTGGLRLQELKQGFLVTARAIPRWKGLPVPDLFDAALSQPLALLDFAIKANEPRQFARPMDA